MDGLTSVLAHFAKGARCARVDFTPTDSYEQSFLSFSLNLISSWRLQVYTILDEGFEIAEKAGKVEFPSQLVRIIKVLRKSSRRSMGGTPPSPPCTIIAQFLQSVFRLIGNAKTRRLMRTG